MSEFRDSSGAARASPAGGDDVEELVFLYLEEREQGLVRGYEDFAKRHSSTSALVKDRILALERAGLAGDAPAEALPERLGPFRVVARLGGGGMGVVYEAEDSSLGRRVALKLIRPEQIYFPQAKERFRREVEAVAKLSHPGIVPIYSFAEDGGVPYFAMELVQGASLGDVLKDFAGRASASLTAKDLAASVTSLSGSPCAHAPLFEGSWTRAVLEIARQVAEALEHAHERGVVHRDVKPSNVMITTDGRARLVDFGLATRAGTSKLTRTGAQLGSMPYMPPEIVAGRATESGPASDVYSLGVSIYECLTLALPFQADSEPLLASRIVAGVHEPLSARNPDASVDVQTICAVAMELEPARRYASAAALSADLARVLARQPIAARPTSRWIRARRFAERHPGGVAAAALAALVVVGGPVGYAVLQSRAAEKERELNAELRTAGDALRASNRDLSAAKSELETKNAELSGALSREQAQSARAERNFGHAFAAIDEMLVTVGSDDLREVPRFDPVRTRLLERALEFYGRLQQDDPTNLDVRRELARTARSMGDVLATLGREDESLAQYELAVERARALMDEGAADDETRYVLASALGMVGARHLRADRHDEARAALAESVETIAPLAAARPDDVPIQHCAITGSTNLGLVAFRKGEFAEAFERFTASTTAARRLHAADPEDERASNALASSLSFAAVCGKRLGKGVEAGALEAESWELLRELAQRPDPTRSVLENFLENSVNYGLTLMTADPVLAERVLRSGLEIGKQLAADFPTDPEARRGLVGLAVNLGIHQINQQHFVEAEDSLAVAIEFGEQLRVDEPGNYEYPFLLASAYGARSAARLERRDLAGARADIEHSIQTIEDVRRTLPNHPSVIATHASCLMQRAEVLLAEKQRAQAIESMQEALALGALRADVAFQAFESWWNLARDAERDPALDAAARQDERDALATEALDQLESAIRQGFSDRARLETLADYEGLRGDARFRELVARIASSGK